MKPEDATNKALDIYEQMDGKICTQHHDTKFLLGVNESQCPLCIINMFSELLLSSA